MILSQVWRIHQEKINVNTLNERPEETTGVSAKEDCSISAGMGKYIPVQTKREITTFVFAYNTTVSSSTGVTPHYAMFGFETTLPVDWVFSTPSVEKRTMSHWTQDMMEERQQAYKSMRELQGGIKSEAECSDVQALDTEYPNRMLSVVFQSENHP